jgi:hypothetical protein
MCHVTDYTPDKTEVMFPNFQNLACCKKYSIDNKHNSLHLAGKYSHLFVHGHHLFLKEHIGPLKNLCALLRTDNFHGKISWHVFVCTLTKAGDMGHMWPKYGKNMG